MLKSVLLYITFTSAPVVTGVVDVDNVDRSCCRYDLLVNGGGAVSLVFQRPSFVTQHKNVMVASNSFVVVDTVILLTADQQRLQRGTRHGSRHNCTSRLHDQPVVVSSHLLSALSISCHTLNTVRLESQVPRALVHFCRAMRCISAAYAVMRCLSVCLSRS